MGRFSVGLALFCTGVSYRGCIKRGLHTVYWFYFPGESALFTGSLHIVVRGVGCPLFSSYKMKWFFLQKGIGSRKKDGN